MSKSKDRNLGPFISEADAAVSRRSKGCLALLATCKSIEDWVSDCPDVNQLVVRIHGTVDEALSVLLADPTRELPAPLRHVADSDLTSRYSWAALRLDTQAGVRNVMNYGLAELAARRIVGSAIERRHYALLESACERYCAEYRAAMGRYREPWDALCLLAAVAFGEHAKVVECFERDLHFDLAVPENASRELAKLAYLLAKLASGTAKGAMKYGAKTLLLVAQFNYLRWVARDEEDARVDLVAVVLATQLYQEIVGPKAESTEAFFSALSPAAVVARMQSEVPPSGG